MKAMVFAAGLGTRLRPITNDRPKALVTIAGRTLLEITLARLRTFDVREVIVNVHHFADQVADYLAANQNFGMRIELSREEVLLDTGGGLKKAAWFFQEPGPHSDKPFLVHNVDVLSTIDLAHMAQFHAQHNALATLAVADRQTSRPLLFSAQGHLLGRGSSTNPSDVILSESAGAQTMDAQAEGAPGPSPSGIGESTNVANTNSEAALAFGGIHVISPRIFDQLGEDGAFSIIDAYIRLAANGETILGFRSDGAYWRDLGRPDDLTAAERDMASGRYPAG